MKKKRLIVGVAVLVAICVLAVFLDPTYVSLGLLRNESFYQGRPTTYWSREIQKLRPSTGFAGLLVYLDKFFDLFRTTEPVKKEDLTLLKGGPEAVPVLKELLRDKEPFVRWNAAFALLDAGDVQPREVVPALCDALMDFDPAGTPSPGLFLSEHEDTRCRAILALDRIGPEPEITTAIPTLVLALEDHTCMTDKEFPADQQYIDGLAQRLLGRIGRPAVPALIQALENPKPEVRVRATRALETGLEEAREGVPALWKALNDRPTCAAAAHALWTLDAETEAVVPPVLAALDDPDSAIRRDAVRVLGEMVLEADAVIPALLRALQDKHDYIRAEAAVALGQFGPQARPKIDSGSREVVRALIVALKDEGCDVRREAAGALGQLGPEAGPAVPALVETLNENNGYIAGSAAMALGQIGPDAKVAVPALVKAVKDPAKDTSVPSLRKCAISALRTLCPEDPGVVEALVGALNDSEAGWDASEALAVLGSLVEPALITASKDKDPNIRRYTARTLGKIGSRAEAAVPRLIELLRCPDKEVRWVAAKALGEIGPDARAAIPALRQALKDPEVWVWAHAAYALWSVDPKSGTGIAALIDALKSADRQKRYHATEALSGIGGDARAAIPRLIEALKDQEGDHIRGEAAKALGNIGPAAKAAIPALIEALKDDEPWVQKEAAFALGKLASNAKPAVSALREARQKMKNDLRMERFKRDKDRAQEALVKIIEALWRINGDAAEAVPELILLLKCDYGWVRRSAAEVVGIIGPEAREAVPALIRVLKDFSNWEEDKAAAAALGAIGPDARAAVPALMKAVKNKRYRFFDSKEALAPVAAAALKKIDPEAAAKAGIR